MNNKLIAPILVTASSIGLCVSALGQERFDSFDAKFQKRLYLGIGGGVSDLDPDTSDVEGIDVIDENDSAANATIGLDLTRRLSFELQYTDLGTADLTGGAEVEYTEVSVSGLLYLWNPSAGDAFSDYDGLDTRTGFSIYGRLGGGEMDNTAIGVDARRVNDFQVTAGLGAEYGLRNGLALRAEYISYDTDAQYAGLSLLYRIGRLRNSGGAKTTELPSLPPPQPISSLPPPPTPALIPSLSETPVVATPAIPATPAADGSLALSEDKDADGVPNAQDNCSDTVAGTPVGDNGCPMFNGTIDGVNFLTGSDTLTSIARETLDGVVARMEEFPNVRVSVHAHTDSRGEEETNMQLSRRRALSVVRYLTAQGVNLGRFEARAYGERSPIADNSTAEGRQLNRRVEFVTL